VFTALTGAGAQRFQRVVDQQLGVARRARDADLVHLPDFRPVLLDRRPFLLTVHDVCWLDHPEWFPRPVVRYKSALLKLALAKRPWAVVCVSGYTRSRLRAHAPRLRSAVHVIRPGFLEPPAVAPEPAAGADYFLTLSTIEPRKNHLGLLAAFKASRAAGLSLRWKVAGATGYAGDEIVAELRATDGVDVLGPVDDAERERLYGEAAFVAVPSLVEGFGLPVGEALRRGVPVVAARGSGLDEVGGDAVLRVEPADRPAWVEALSSLEDVALRRDLRARGLAESAALGWEAPARRYVDVYHGRPPAD
jgi:glycosyltransferase involved in cell wall biosynthesis